MIKGLVNLITPAYNSANFIFRLFDSVLSQTYPKIKMYIIDDGSIDNTREVIEEYIPLFEKRGYELIYKYQDNAGASAAVNKGLKLVDGEYLLWPDSDDWYKEADSIEKLVEVLRESEDDVGVVRCRYEFVTIQPFQTISTISFPRYGVDDGILEDAVYEQNGFSWMPGGWIVKTKFLDEFIPNRDIYSEKDAGQNSQILFPYFLNSKCVSMDDVLYCCWKRDGSHSRAKGFDKEKSRVEAYIRVWLNECNTLFRKMDISKYEEYYKTRLWMYYFRLLKNDFEYKETSIFRRHINECKDLKVPLPKRYKKMYLWTKFFSLKSYCMISNYRSSVCNAIRKNAIKCKK